MKHQRTRVMVTAAVLLTVAGPTFDADAIERGRAWPTRTLPQLAATNGPVIQPRSDGKDPEALIRRMYSVLSGPAGARDWESFASLFHEKAVMGASAIDAQGNLGYRSFTPAEYVKRNDEFFRTQDFYVDEIHRVTEQFGEIMHLFSTYRFRAESKGQVQQSGRGINSIQLIRDANRWWIISIQFTNERPDLSVPKQYLGKGRSY